MERMKISERTERGGCDHDQEASVLYLTLDEPRSALAVDVGDAVVIRCGEKKQSVHFGLGQFKPIGFP